MADRRPIAEWIREIRKDAIEAGGRSGARFWYSEGLKISEGTTDPEARWEFLMALLRNVGWPAQKES